MDTISRAQTIAGGRSGGKIVRQSRKIDAKTPYDRPQSPTPPPSESSSSNWLTGLVFPGATRMIAKGATKVFSFMTDTIYSSSSSSSSDSEDDGVSCDDGAYDVSFEDGKQKEKDGTSSEMIKPFRKEPRLLKEDSDSKRVIEQLLNHETFSREECNKLIDIIKSRVVDRSTGGEEQTTGMIESSSRRFSDTHDMCSKALMEAKKWLEETKVGSSSKSELELGISPSGSIQLQHLNKSNVVSPVDMAKSYMQARPPWASPSLRHAGSSTPSPIAIDLFKEETPFSVGGNSFFLTQKRDTLAASSWNIQDEIRRVRSKATEDMLCNLPSTRIDLSTSTSAHKTSSNLFLADSVIGGSGDRMHDSVSLAAIEPVNVSVNMAAGLSSCREFPGSFNMGMTEDSSQIVLSSNPTFFSEPNEDPKLTQIIEKGTTDSHHSMSPELLLKQHEENDTEIAGGSISTNENIKISGAPNVNGSASSRSSLSAGVDVVPNQSNENNMFSATLINDKLTNCAPVEERCGFLSEASVEIPLVNEINNVADGSQNSSTEHLQGSTHERRQADLKNSAGGNDATQEGKKPGRYQRKGRGRGK